MELIFLVILWIVIFTLSSRVYDVMKYEVCHHDLVMTGVKQYLTISNGKTYTIKVVSYRCRKCGKIIVKKIIVK